MARTTNSPQPAPPGGWPELMDVATVAAYVGVGEEEVRVRCREGRYKHTRDGRRYLIRKEWLDEQLDAPAQGGPIPAPAA
jgi:excisionase family DNA binding protein